MIDYPLVKFLNRVLADYPTAREALKGNAGKTIEATIGPISTWLRVSQAGDFEMVGASGSASPTDGATGRNATPDVAFQIPLALLARLARGDESAFTAVDFAGDSEFAATLSSIARNISWDAEEDLSHVVGDMAARRIVGGASAIGAWSRDAAPRFLSNVAEYLTEEARAFATTRELESLATENENLRDTVARLEAKVNAKINAKTNSKKALSSLKPASQH